MPRIWYTGYATNESRLVRKVLLPRKGFIMNTKRQQDNKLTILYERLSKDDDLAGESNSIQHQKALLEDYANKNGFRNIVHMTDDGVSGTRFDRPNFMKMMDEVAAGNVENVITKDLSRFGRDHLRVGLYTETLREHCVRFIAVLDNVDSALGEDDFAPFRNIINEWAARDASRKVKSVLKTKGMSGRRLSSVPIYGYMHDPNDKDKWVIEPESAAVVRRIYQLTIEGLGPQEIARVLMNEKIERPSNYMNRRGITNHALTDASPYDWNDCTVKTIISKAEYKGDTVNFRTYKESYKDRKQKLAAKEDWVVFHDTHEAIIDPHTWETAQRLRKTCKRTDSLGVANPLTGKMICADCGARMYNHRNPNPKPRVYPDGRVYNRPPSDVYGCSTYNKSVKRSDFMCTQHGIRTAVVRELLLDTIRTVSNYVRGNEDEFIRKVREMSTVQQIETAKSHRKRIIKNERRIAELDMLFQKTYEDNAVKRLSDERFAQLSASYEREQADLKQQNITLQSEVDSFDADSIKADRFIWLVKKYKDFTELSTPMINEFVDRIVVHEPDRSTGKRVQKVDIYLNFIGKFTLPEEAEPNPADVEARRLLDEKRIKKREYNRRWYAKQKEKTQQQQESA